MFGNFQNITGGAGNDTFAFQTAGRLTGVIDGGGGVNTLTYAAYTGDVIVDLLIHSATGVDGGVSNVQNVTGSNGNSMLVGDGNPNVLVGGAGRNVLIGDGGADSLTGGGQDNILIGDSTVWDANLTALQAIFAEWTRTDLSFEQRLAHLISEGQSDGRLNGNYVLNKKTVISDGAIDTLTGGNSGALDWFFVTLKQDTYEPHNPRDHITGL
jgi:Ca2+-binding RTX toxin-like protein